MKRRRSASARWPRRRCCRAAPLPRPAGRQRQRRPRRRRRALARHARASSTPAGAAARRDRRPRRPVARLGRVLARRRPPPTCSAATARSARSNLLARRVEQRLQQAGNSIGGAISQDGTLVAAQNYTPGGIKVFDAETLALVADIPAEHAPGKTSRVVGLADLPGQRFIFSLFDADARPTA